ncbi:MAG: oligoendopeptidase F [Bacteroidales bacterium]|nr:MAG: oligoendopeptidase F [Bacteroidales bacterium]
MRKLSLLLLILTSFLSMKAQNDKQQKAETPDYRYNWDFTDIYPNWDAWSKDFEVIKQDIPKYLEYKGKLGESPEKMLEYFEFTEKSNTMINRLYVYVMLQKDVDGKNPMYSNKEQELQNVFIQLGMNSGWVSPELATIPSEKVYKWMETNPKLAIYKHDMESFYRLQAHILPEATQNIVTQFSSALDASSRIYSSLSIADIEYPTVKLSTGEELVASPAMVSKVYTSNQNQDDRKKMGEASRLPYLKTKNTYSDIYLGMLQGRWASTKLQGYKSCLDGVLESNNISKEVYTNLLQVAKENSQPLQKYYELRKKALKLDKYYMSDNWVELVDFSKNYKWEEAVSIVKEALKPMGTDYNNLLLTSFQGGWIDVFEKPGKQTGAYNMTVFGIHPYILMNWDETRDNVFTLAHELGHAMHGLLANNNQPMVYSGSATVVAEVASTFNENMLLDYMLDKSTDPKEKVTLLVQAIDNIVGTFYRQAQFAEFEYKVHEMIEQDQPLNAETFAQIYNESDIQYNGTMIERSEDGKYSWPRISHFYNYSFYVYNYAVSFSASSSLYEQVGKAKDKKSAQVALDKYLTLLKSGSNDYPVILLQKAGVDLTTKEPFLAVIRQMEKLVNQLEKELKTLGKI